MAKPGVVHVIAFLLVLGAFTTRRVPAQLHSQTEPIQVTGQVRFANGGQPADEVIVRLERFSGGFVGEVRTDRMGKFRFQNLSPAQYHVVIRHPGFQEIQREVNLVMVSSDYLQLQLLPETKPATDQPPPSRLVLDARVPPEARAEFEKADAALMTGKKQKIAEGIQYLLKAISLYPDFLEAQLKLGAAYMDLQEWDKAEQALRRALEINPKTANALFALGEVYWRQKKLDEAEKTLRQGLAIEGRSWLARYTLGRLYWSKGDLASAGRQVALSIQLNPDFADAHLLGANILLRAGKPDDAVLEYQEYLRLAPKGEHAAQAKETIQKLTRQKSQE